MLDTLLISFDNTHGEDAAILIIGRKAPNEAVKIVNAFQGKEACDLYRQLTTVKKGGSTNG